MLEVRVLGPLTVSVDDVAVTLGSPSKRRVVAALVAGGGVASRDRLMAAVWGEDLPVSALRSLQTYVSRLRRSLGPERIETRPPGWALHADVVDAVEFERLGTAARGADGWDAVAAFDAALGWWGGPAYEEFGHEPFAMAEARRLESARQALLVDRADALLAVGAAAESVSALEALLADEPLHERAWALLVHALAVDGRTAEALRAAQRCRQALIAVGLEPSEQLTRAEQTAATGGSPRSDEPSQPRPRHSRRQGRLVGRDDDFERVARAAQPGTIVTVTGPGGVGKSRLASEVASAIGPRFPDGACFCDLTTVEHDDAVVAVVLASLRVPLTAPLEDKLVNCCARRHLLLVLDNCEHVIDEAARLARVLLGSAPQLAILATSREPLHVRDEHIVLLEPLGSEHAVRLYQLRAARAGASADDPMAIEQVCRRLDNLPLAIEMAAAWSRSLAATELAERLADQPGLLSHPGRDIPERHRTLDTAIGWSYNLLDDDERDLLERLSVFAGPVDFDTGVVVAAPHIARDAASRRLMRLVDRCLVLVDHQTGTVRLRMLETTRDFAADILTRRGKHASAVADHARWAAHTAEQIAAGFHTRDARRWADVADRNLDELRTAVFRSIDSGSVDLALRIVAGLAPLTYEWLRADISDWARRSIDVARAAGAEIPTHAFVCSALGPLHSGELDDAEAIVEGVPGVFADIIRSDVALYRGDYTACIQRAVTAAETAKVDGRATLLTLALMNVALALGYGGDVDSALDTAAEVRTAAELAGSPSALAWADFLEGEFLAERDPRRALLLLERALDRARETRSAMTEGIALVSITTLRARHGEPLGALPAFEDAIRHWQTRDDWTHQRVTLRNLALLLERLGLDDNAAILLAALDTEAPATGTEAQHLDAARADLAQRLGARFDSLVARGQALGRHGAIDLALRCTAERPVS